MLKANLASDAIISGVKKLASAVVEVGKASFEGYSQYEQLVGGVETLFKNSANVVQNYAKNAYKTAGLSANDYMSTVTSFSASLLQSLGQDTAAAAEYADMAITDMSDNANKMGTSMESIQNAYQGFAKQNYTMLDNLKLGYGGTKAEMERLLEDAEKIKAANGEMVEYSIDSFADMVEAIHVVQENMDITGTTAKEAEDTIEGSVNSMKAAWENLATGMADETADMEQLTQNFVDSVGTAAGNIIPRIGQIVSGIGTGVSKAVTYLRTTDGAVGKVVAVLDDLTTAAVVAGTALAAVKTASEMSKAITTIKGIATAMSELSAESGVAAIAQAALNGEFTVGEVLVGLLTGKISLAAAAQAAWNAVMAVNPYILLAAGVAALTLGIKHLSDTYVSEANTMGEAGETAEEVAENIEKLKQQYQDISDEIKAKAGEDVAALQNRLVTLEEAIAVAEARYEELAGAEAEAAEEANAVAQATANVEATIGTITTAAETYVQAAQGIVESFFDVYDSVYNSLYNASTAFTEVAVATTMSYDQIMASLEANTAFNDRYTDSLNYITNAAAKSGVNIESLTSYLAGMSNVDAAGALEAIRAELEGAGGDSKETARVLQELTDTIGDYGESAQTAGYQMADAVVDVQEQLQEAFDAYDEAIQGLDNYDELYAAGKSSMTGLLLGIQYSTPNIIGEVNDLAETMKSALQTNFDNFTLRIEAVVETVEASVSGFANADGYATGLDYVPYDNFPAYLHKGETVLTTEEAAAYRAGKLSGNVSTDTAASVYMDGILQYLGELVASSRENNAAILADKTFQVGDREFGRLVKQYV